MASFTLNGKPVTVDGDSQSMLLWALRDEAGLTGTKYGCGASLCGACTVHVEGKAVQKAWLDKEVPQCGYCQSGQIMSAVALLTANTAPTDEDINLAMNGNICRCGTYLRIRAAIKEAAKTLAGGAP